MPVRRDLLPLLEATVSEYPDTSASALTAQMLDDGTIEPDDEEMTFREIVRLKRRAAAAGG